MESPLSEVKMLVAGEYGLLIEFAAIISPEVNRFVLQLTKLLHLEKVTGIIEIVPTYRSVMVYFDPLLITRQKLVCLSRQLLSTIKRLDIESLSPKIVNVPVCYGGVLGPDLEFVARYTGLSTREVVRIHTAKPYLVYMLGFTPGFPYLGGLDEQIAIPRREKPRIKIPMGSVGIGGNQTGFYPSESPGEWWLIGRTPIKAFNPQSANPFLVSAGDYLHFVDITIDEYFAIRRDVAAGTYIPRSSDDIEGEGR